MSYPGGKLHFESEDSNESFDSMEDEDEDKIIYTSSCNECEVTHPRTSVHQCVTCGFKICVFCFDRKDKTPGNYMILEPWEEFLVFTCSKLCYTKKLER